MKWGGQMNNEFDLQRAINGEPIETVFGTPVEFIAYRPTAKESKQLIVQGGDDVQMYYVNGRYKDQGGKCPYDLRMKTPLKQINWAKLPVDTRIIRSLSTGKSERYFSYFSSGMVNFYRDGATSKTAESPLPTLNINPSDVTIAPNQPWTIWLGGNSPIPDGLEFEYMINDDPGKVMVAKESASEYLCLWHPKVIYAYRLTGKVLDGWTLFKNYNEMGWANE
jgi:hypothetical protein